MRIIYVHGFGGRSFEHDHASVMRTTGRDVYGGFPVETFAWPSGRIGRWTGREWREAKAEAARQAPLLWERIAALDRSERVYLVGFSLGSLVALEATRAGGPDAGERIAGICLLGAAVRSNYDFAGLAHLRRGVLNYYSPTLDGVLRRVFTVEEGEPAAGEVGFATGFGAGPVLNLRVHKAHKLFSGYAQVARAVAQVIGYWEGLPGPVEIDRDFKDDDWKGDTFWDEVYRRGPYVIQRWRVGARWGDFRLLERIGERTRRVARARYVAPLLAELDRLQPDSRPSQAQARTG